MSNRKDDVEDLLAEIESLKAANAVLESELKRKESGITGANQALKSGKHHSMALAELIPDMMFRINNKGIYLDYKAAGEDLFYQNESIIGKNNRDIMPPDFANLVDKKIRETLKTGIVQVFGYRLPASNGHPVTEYEARMVPCGFDEVIAIVRNVTEQKNAERALRERETNARAILDASSDILCLLDTSGVVLDCNMTLSAYFGLTPGEITGRSIFDFLPQEEIESHKKFLSDFFMAGKSLTGETDISGKTAEYSIYPVKDENGLISKAAVYAFDTTEQKSARRALVESEEIFRSFMENSPIYVFFKDAQIRPVRLSRNYETMLGMPMKKILGKNMAELFPSDLAENMVKDDLLVLHKGEPVKIEEEFNQRHYSTIKFPVFIDGKPKYLAGFTIDITEQKQAELDLRVSEERFRKIYAEGSTPIAMLDRDFRFISANQVFRDTFGYRETELKKMTFREITHPDHLEQNLEYLSLLIKGEINIYRTEKRYITKNQQIVWGNAQVSIVRDSKENFLNFLVIINNITGYKLAEAEIRAKNEQLEKINAEKDKFFSIIAHDLRSPFNAFIGLTQIMAEELYTMRLDEIELIATNLKNSATNLYHLLENLLEWSMIQRGIKSFNPQPLILSEITNNCILTLSDTMRRKSIKMMLDVPVEIEINADSNMLETVIRNLISNAVKFTPCGGVITVQAYIDESRNVLMSIEDTGIGMNPEIIEKLFSYDTRINRRGTEGEPSTGLGLLLCKELIAKHGGNLKVDSKEGSGSKFTFTLPEVN